MKTIKIIDILVKKATGEEIPKIIEYRTNYYKLVERVDGNYNYRLIDYPSMRECDSYLEDDYYMINILNHEVEIIEDTAKEEKKIPEKLGLINYCEDQATLLIHHKVDEIIDYLKSKGE